VRALLCPSPRKLALVERPAPVAAPGAPLLRIKPAGVCGADLHIFDGARPTGGADRRRCLRLRIRLRRFAAGDERRLRSRRHGGGCVLVSIARGDIVFSDPEFHKHETTLLGSRNATRADFETVFAALRSGAIAIRALATDRASLDDAARVF
jgi:threonine dehydrogenase-like Zn-dependent dehydrogenase